MRFGSVIAFRKKNRKKVTCVCPSLVLDRCVCVCPDNLFFCSEFFRWKICSGGNCCLNEVICLLVEFVLFWLILILSRMEWNVWKTWPKKKFKFWKSNYNVLTWTFFFCLIQNRKKIKIIFGSFKNENSFRFSWFKIWNEFWNVNPISFSCSVVVFDQNSFSINEIIDSNEFPNRYLFI